MEILLYEKKKKQHCQKRFFLGFSAYKTLKCEQKKHLWETLAKNSYFSLLTC